MIVLRLRSRSNSTVLEVAFRRASSDSSSRYCRADAERAFAARYPRAVRNPTSACRITRHTSSIPKRPRILSTNAIISTRGGRARSRKTCSLTGGSRSPSPTRRSASSIAYSTSTSRRASSPRPSTPPKKHSSSDDNRRGNHDTYRRKSQPSSLVGAQPVAFTP